MGAFKMLQLHGQVVPLKVLMPWCVTDEDCFLNCVFMTSALFHGWIVQIWWHSNFDIEDLSTKRHGSRLNQIFNPRHKNLKNVCIAFGIVIGSAQPCVSDGGIGTKEQELGGDVGILLLHGFMEWKGHKHHLLAKRCNKYFLNPTYLYKYIYLYI